MRRVSIALLSALFAMYGSTVMAVDFPNGLYWGGNAGIAEEENSCNEIPVPQGFDEFAGCDNTSFGWQLFLGYQFMKWISVEGGYVDLGGSDFRVVQDTFSTEMKGWTLNGVFTVPFLEKFGLYGTGGAFFWDGEVKVERVGGTPSATLSDTGTDYFWGLGFRFPFTENVGINLEVKQFIDVGTGDIKSDYGLYTAGLLFRF